MSQDIIVRMKNVVMSFSGNTVLDNVNFELRRGEVHALMGANGAGKSTLIKILNGIYTPISGVIEIEGAPVQIRTPKDAEKHGLAFVHQELSICDNMSVAENIYIGKWEKNRLGLYDKRKTSMNAQKFLQVMGVDLDLDVPVRTLRMAEKQIVEILKTLTTRAKVIVLDEPTSSLNEKEKQNFFKIVEQLKENGVSIIFISHFLEDIIAMSDRVTVLKDGVNNGVFQQGEYTKEDLVVAMMGRQLLSDEPCETPIKEDAPVALELRNFGSKKKFNNINLKVSAGDIVGVCGLLGAGKTEVARCIFGLDPYDEGELFIFGEKIVKPRPDIMIEKKITLLTEERKREGFVPLLSIRENESLSILKRFRNRLGAIKRKEQSAFSKEISERVSVKMLGVEQSVISLSGGNQQKVTIAKCLASDPKIFLLDEPTRGVDVYAKSEVYRILRKEVEKGTSVIIFSSELEELIENCSKIFILKKGCLSNMVYAAQTSKNELLSLIN